MARRLPPLNACQAFEATARLLSFTLAAEELHVTKSAVSHHVRSLEQYLDVKLFDRTGRKIKLTRAGQACLPELREGFDKLASAMKILSDAGAREVVVLNVSPCVAQKWVMPRLEDFRNAHPELDLQLDTSDGGNANQAGNYDVAISTDDTVANSASCEPLMTESIFPVCSPELTKGANALRTTADLGSHNLIDVEDSQTVDPVPDWESWLKRCGNARSISTSSCLTVGMWGLALQAAIDGHGVALGGSIIAQNDLDSGRLVRPFEEHHREPKRQYHLVANNDAKKTQRVLKWLREQASAQQQDASAQVFSFPAARAQKTAREMSSNVAKLSVGGA